MTNKINGINVSECPLFDKKTGCYYTFNGECVKDSCAVYKWLLEHKRLQEENKELKAENEKLKQSCLVMPKVNQLAVPIDRYKKLYKALEEIRDIAKYSIMHNSELNLNYQIILQNINEVLNDRD